MYRSEIPIDLTPLRRNCATLLRALAGAELWAVVKADGYGHGACDVAGAALGAGATALCVATVPEGLALRREFSTARIVVMGPATSREVGQARDARLELVVSGDEIPPGIVLGVLAYGFEAGLGSHEGVHAELAGLDLLVQLPHGRARGDVLAGELAL